MHGPSPGRERRSMRCSEDPERFSDGSRCHSIRSWWAIKRLDAINGANGGGNENGITTTIQKMRYEYKHQKITL